MIIKWQNCLKRRINCCGWKPLHPHRNARECACESRYTWNEKHLRKRNNNNTRHCHSSSRHMAGIKLIPLSVRHTRHRFLCARVPILLISELIKLGFRAIPFDSNLCAFNNGATSMLHSAVKVVFDDGCIADA